MSSDRMLRMQRMEICRKKPKPNDVYDNDCSFLTSTALHWQHLQRCLLIALSQSVLVRDMLR